MCVVSSVVVRKLTTPEPMVVELNVYSQKNNAGHYVIHCDGVWDGKRYIGYGQVNETMCNTSKALSDWLMRAMPDQLYKIGGYAADIKIGKEFQPTYFSEVLYGLYINLNNDKVMIDERIGMKAIKAILAKMGWLVEVYSNQHIIHKIVLTEIV